MNIDEMNEKQLNQMRHNFKLLRESKGWSIEALSKSIDIPVCILTIIENGGDFDLHYLFALCKLYDIEPYKIFLPLPQNI